MWTFASLSLLQNLRITGISFHQSYSWRFRFFPMSGLFDYNPMWLDMTCLEYKTVIIWLEFGPGILITFGKFLDINSFWKQVITCNLLCWSHTNIWFFHWGPVTHIYFSKIIIIDSDNTLSAGRRQAIIWTSGGMLLTRTLGIYFGEILIEINTFSFKKMHLTMSTVKWRLFRLGLNELTADAAQIIHRRYNNENSCYSHGSAPSHYLNQCRLIVNWNLRNKIQWDWYQNTKHFIHKSRLRNGGHFVQGGGGGGGGAMPRHCLDTVYDEYKMVFCYLQIQLAISYHWFRYWLGAKQTPNNFLNQ